LLGIMNVALERFSHLWQLHFEIVFPSYLPIGIFEDLCRDLFGSDDTFQAHRMIQGLDNLTVDSGRALWSLSRSALTIPEVKQVLEEVAATDVIAALERTEAGRAFLGQLRAYLQEYGRRTYNVDFSRPSWIEDPTAVIKTLKDYVGQPDRDWYGERRKMITERDTTIAAARARLQGYPKEVVGQFEFFLRTAQVGVVLTEDHNFLIDFQGNYAIRRVLLAVGKALAGAGIITKRDDVFFLTPDEIKAAVRARSDQRALVVERQAEMDHFRQITPPPAIGTLPPGPPPDNLFVRVIGGKLFGQPVEQPAQAGTIRGYAGSPGVARGVARVARSFADTSRLRNGDILVAETTAPPWTPLFASVAAVVTDTGGILSHSAVVAREYGIPAVVGTGIGTTAILDGQMIEVDGNTGFVRILETA
jgi:rifampicin phosphotransferase